MTMNPRTILLIALLLLGYLLWAQWQEDYSRPQVQPATASATPANGASAGKVATPEIPAAGAVPGAAGVPAATAAAPAVAARATGAPTPKAPHVVVTTDVLRVEVDTRGGNLVVADLLAYPQQPKDYAHPVRLLDDADATFFEAQSGLVSNSGAAPDHQAQFSAAKDSYTLPPDADSVEVPLTWTDASGLVVHKVFVFHRASYVIDQREEIDNKGNAAWTGNAYRQLQRVPPVIDTHGLKGYANTDRYSFVGAAWYSPQDKFQKLAFDKYVKEPLNKSVAGGWISLQQHYFFAAWIPPTDETDQFATVPPQTVDGYTRYLIRALSPPIEVAPGGEKTLSARLYVGPKLQARLDAIAPGLALSVDYGIFTVIAEPIHWVLSKLHALTGNWGVAIILLVILIKALFFKLSETQYRSMARMRKLQPRVQALKDRYGDDRQKMNQAMMELYQKEKINPLGGCLPMVVQIPVFFALYWVLLESVELRQAPFFGWIQNLTAPDPYYILPILNGLVMVASQFLTPTTGMDPTQAKMMKIMPVAMSFIFLFFPAGLVLYYVVNGALSLAQQWIITRRIEAGEKAKA